MHYWWSRCKWTSRWNPWIFSPSTVTYCRICHGTDNLIRAWQCRGSCTNVHAACLQMWVTHRQNGGMNMKEATTCELCLGTFAHRLERQHVGRFLLSRGAWRAWMHIAYLAYCCRRFCGAGPSIMQALTGCTSSVNNNKAVIDQGSRIPGMRWQRGRTWPKQRMSAMLALHYRLLIILDARTVFSVIRRWRDKNTKIIVCDQNGCEAVVVENEVLSSAPK